MADCEVSDLDKAVAIGGDVEIDLTLVTQWIVRPEPAQRNDAAAGGLGRLDGIEDIGRAPGAADGKNEIAIAAMQFDLLGKDTIVTKVVAETCQHGRIVQRERTYAAILGVVGRHVAGDGGAAAVANEDQLVASRMDRPRAVHDPVDSIAEIHARPACRGDLGRAEQIRLLMKIAVEVLGANDQPRLGGHEILLTAPDAKYQIRLTLL